MNHEIFRFEGLIWDVTALQRAVVRNPQEYGPKEMPIDEGLLHSISLYQEPDEERIRSMDVSRRDTPILAVIQEDGKGRVVDGHHRLLRRHRDGCSTVRCYVVPWAVASRCVRPIDQSD